MLAEIEGKKASCVPIRGLQGYSIDLPWGKKSVLAVN